MVSVVQIHGVKCFEAVATQVSFIKIRRSFVISDITFPSYRYGR